MANTRTFAWKIYITLVVVSAVFLTAIHHIQNTNLLVYTSASHTDDSSKPADKHWPSKVVKVHFEDDVIAFNNMLAKEQNREFGQEIDSLNSRLYEMLAEDRAAVDEKAVADEKAAADEKAVVDEKAAADEKAAGDEKAAADEKAARDEKAVVDEKAAVDEKAVMDEKAAADEKAAGDEKAAADEKVAVDEKAAKQKLLLPPSFLSLDANSAHLVYSAHHDSIQSVVKIIGFGPMSDKHVANQFSCTVEDNYKMQEKTQLSVYYRISTFYPWKEQIYDSYIYACKTTFKRPTSITIKSQIDNNIGVVLPISTEQTTPKYQFAVCVEPLVHNYDDIWSLRHFLAVNSVFGAEHFFFYVTEASQKVVDLLESMSTVSVYPWRLNEAFNKTHAFGQKAANNHCLYEHRKEVKYLVFIDIDEVLVPQVNANWSALVGELERTNPRQGALVFQSKLFPKKASTDSKTKFRLWSLSHRKSVGVFQLYQWSKVMVETSRTDVVDIHKVRQMLPSFSVTNVDPNVAVVNHYREYDYKDGELSEDNRVIHFKQKILHFYKMLFPSISIQDL